MSCSLIRHACPEAADWTLFLVSPFRFVSVRLGITVRASTISILVDQGTSFVCALFWRQELFDFSVAIAAHHSQSQEAKAKQEEEGEDDPLKLIREDTRAKDIIRLILSPCVLTPDISQGIEVAIFGRNRFFCVLEQRISEHLHVEEVALASGQAQSRQGLNANEGIVIVDIRFDDLAACINDDGLRLLSCFGEVEVVALGHKAVSFERCRHVCGASDPDIIILVY